MIDIFKLERLNVDTIDWSQYSGTYNSSYWGKLVVDKYSVSYFNPDGRSGQTLISAMYDYSTGTEILVFDHKKFLDRVYDTQSPQQLPRASQTSALDVELLIKLKQGGHTTDELVALRGAGII